MLRGLVGKSAAELAPIVRSWQLTQPEFERTVVLFYKPLYAEYAREFAAAVPAIAAQLAAAHEVHARRHWGGDRALANSQARDRWAVPTMYPSAVADLDGAPLPIVFVPAGDRWGTLAGLDAAVLARARAYDSGCADLLALAGPPGVCSDGGWMMANAALRADRAAFDRACQRARAMCNRATRSP
jgi:hypothetical protein